MKRRIVEQKPFNAATPLRALEGHITPSRLFYVRNHFEAPQLDKATWRLEVTGAVDRTLEMSLAELQALGETEITLLMECAGNGRASMQPRPPGTPWRFGAVSTARFAGVPLKAVIEQAGLQDQVLEILFEGSDQGKVETGHTVNYKRSLPRSKALEPNTLLAWSMNGSPLPDHHGHPLRLIVPGWYGMASVKWLTRIEALVEPFEGYFQSDRYVYKPSSEAPETPVTGMKVRSLITTPEDGAAIRSGQVTVRGVAWSGRAQVVRVEVSVDGGETWMEADCTLRGSIYEPCDWEYTWAVEEEGTYRLAVRATDEHGNRQPLEPDWNALGYGNNAVHRIVVSVG